MAPIQTFGSSGAHCSTLSMMPSVCLCGGLFKDVEWFLPISRRGNFFRDSFFENSRSYFDSAVQDMLRKWREMNMITESAWNDSRRSFTNNLSLYRQFRPRTLQEENQASTIVSDNKTHKVMIDVQDFTDEDIKVRVAGDREIVVEGQTSSSGDGSFASKKFSRRFVLPSSVNMARVTSVLSSDGVLTIEAPKLETDISLKQSESAAIDVKASTSSATSYLSESSANSKLAESAKQTKANDVVYYCKGCNKKIGSWHKAVEAKSSQDDGVRVPIKIGTSLATGEKNIPIVQDIHENNSQVKVVNVEKTGHKESTSNEIQHNIAVTTDSSLHQKKASSAESDSQANLSVSRNNYDVPVRAPFSILPILRKGPFFSDSFFTGIHKEFQSAVQEILSKWGKTTSSFFENDLPMYRNLRLHNLKEETQAVKSVEDETSHKFVLDVHDFLDGGEVTVKAINDREIVIEGHIEKEEGGSKALKRFLKRFTVPGDIKLSSVTSVVSSDGVLTVTAPKQPSSLQLKEVIIPVDVEARDTKGQISNTKKVNQQSSSISSATAIKANEHIIPINVEGTSVDTRTKQSSHEVKEQKESTQMLNKSRTEGVQKEQGRVEYIIPVDVEGATDSVDKSSVTKSKVEEIYQEKGLHNIQHQSQNVQGSSEHFIPISVEGTSQNTAEITQTKAQESYQQKHQEKVKHQTQAESTLTQSGACHFPHQRAQAIDEEEKKLRISTDIESLSHGTSKKYLPITRRGSFFDDSFFQGYRNSFQNAVKDVLVKSRQNVDTIDNMTTYRSLRQKDLRVENQALHVQEDEDSLKIVVDAKDFINGDITVYVDGEELVIEGKAENSEVKSSSSLTFSHRFLLPEFADFSAISSAISSDGILTVKSPKQGNLSKDAVRKMSTEARSKHESEIEGGHKWEEKRVKESSEQGEGFSSRKFSSSYSSCQQQSSTF